jgi:hypothetical protein
LDKSSAINAISVGKASGVLINSSGINLFSGAENLNSLLLVIVVSVLVQSIAEEQIDALGS